MLDKVVFQAIKTQLGSTVPFAKHLGLELTEVGAGTASAKLPEAKHNANHVGSQHAGALFTVADTASGAAVAGMFGQRILQLRPLVKDAQVRFLKLARGPIVARATVTGDAKSLAKAVDDFGKSEFPVAVELTDANGVRVAAMTFEWHVSKPVPK